MAVVTKQQLENAAVDAQTLEEVVNGAVADSPVTTRLGQELKTIAKIQADMDVITNEAAASAAAALVSENNAATSETNAATSETNAAAAAAAALVSENNAADSASDAATQAAATITIPSNSSILASNSSTARTLANRFAERINVKDYNAKGDNSTDDKTAIQAAIAQAIAVNGCVYFPAGIYMISGALTISGSSTISFIGDGDVSQIKCTAGFTGNNMLSVTSTGTVDLYNMLWDANYPTSSAMSTGDTRAAIEFTGTAGEFAFVNCTLKNTKGNGILFGTSCGKVELDSNRFYNIGDFAVGIHNKNGAIVTSNFIKGCGGGGIYVNQYSFNSKDVTPTVVANNWIEDITDAYFAGTGSRGNGIHTYNTKQAVISGNYIRNCEWSAIRNASAEFINVTGNVCIESGETAIWSEFTHEYNQIVGNLIYKCGMQGWNGAVPTSASGPAISCVNLLSQLGRATLVANNQIIMGRACGIYMEGDVHCVNNVIDGVAFGIVSGTNQYQKDNFISGNRITDRYTRAWATSTNYGVGDRITVNGYVYECITGGTSDSTGSGPSTQTTGITDGTCVWDYRKVSTPLQVGIGVSKGSGTQGFAYVTNNLVLDSTVATIAPMDGNPMVLSTWSTGSKVVMYNNMPGIANTYLPASPNASSGGSLTYVTDTGDMKYFDAVQTKWVNLKRLSGSKTYDAPSLATGTSTSTTVTVTGATVGDFALASLSTIQAGFFLVATVTAADTVEVSVNNRSGSTVDLASGTLAVTVQKA